MYSTAAKTNRLLKPIVIARSTAPHAETTEAKPLTAHATGTASAAIS